MTSPIVPTPDSTDNLKQCTKCGELKPYTAFYRSSKTKTGIETRCKECSSFEQKRWRSRTNENYRPRIWDNSLPDGIKRCAKCGETKSVDEFYLRSDCHLGRDSVCKACKANYYKNHNAELAARRRAENPKEELPRGMKRCNRCNEVKPISEFHKETRAEDGVTSNCRDCRCAYYVARAAARRPPKETIPDGFKRCRKCGQLLALSYFYSGRGKDGKRGSCKKCVEYAQGHIRRARKRGLPNEFSNKDWATALDYFNHRCAVCGRPTGLWHKLSADHWIPISLPDCPGTVPWNIVPLCYGIDGCNNSKNNRDAEEWLINKFGKRKGRAILKRIESYLEGCKPAFTEAG